MNEEDFSNTPLSIGEIRSDKSGDGADWSPRELLLSLLREIDQGKIDANAMVVVWCSPLEDKSRETCWRLSSPDPLVTAGMLSRVSRGVIE